MSTVHILCMSLWSSHNERDVWPVLLQERIYKLPLPLTKEAVTSATVPEKAKAIMIATTLGSENGLSEAWCRSSDSCHVFVTSTQIVSWASVMATQTCIASLLTSPTWKTWKSKKKEEDRLNIVLTDIVNLENLEQPKKRGGSIEHRFPLCGRLDHEGPREAQSERSDTERR